MIGGGFGVGDDSGILERAFSLYIYPPHPRFRAGTGFTMIDLSGKPR